VKDQSEIQVAIALLIRQQRFLLQLRDDIPTIVYPGHWAFFGGHIEPEESPDVAIWRELEEEINYTPPWLKPFKQSRTDNIVRHIYYGPLTVAPDKLELNEGWDLGLWSVEEIHQGERFSAVANRSCPLGAPHQAILLEFLAERRDIFASINSESMQR
jgi:8-oxo-dGTP pyrophosphatase MutT (NUDIX family)